MRAERLTFARLRKSWIARHCGRRGLAIAYEAKQGSKKGFVAALKGKVAATRLEGKGGGWGAFTCVLRASSSVPVALRAFFGAQGASPSRARGWRNPLGLSRAC